VAGVAVAARRIVLDFQNEQPSVSVDVINGTLQKQAGVPFGVNATVADAEDGACPEAACVYSWSPEPTSGASNRPVAFYRFDTLGPRTITATVEDAGGAIGSAALAVNIVNSVPVAEIIRPTSGSNVSTGTPLQLEGTASDVNWSGALPCSSFRWTSSDPADVFTPSSNTCSPQVSFASAGAKTLTLVVDDPTFAGSSDPVSVSVGVFSCAPGACPPTATVSLSRPNFEDQYFIEHTMQIVVSLAHADAPDDNPIRYRLLARRAGMADVLIAAGERNLTGPLDVSDVAIEWTPEDDLERWPGCVIDSREYQLIVEVRDASDTVTLDTRVVSLSCDLI
jgi:hypothetical protein